MIRTNIKEVFVDISLERRDRLTGLNHLSDIIAVIVLYKSSLNTSSAFLSLSTALKAVNKNARMELLVYDNSPVSAFDKNIQYENWNIHYIHDSSNPGVSLAYNTGAKLAEKLNKKWILLVDQDSDFPANSLETYIDSINKYKDVRLFCPILKTTSGIALSPSVFKFNRGAPPKSMEPGLKSLNDYSPINSGLCVQLSLFNEAGGYNNAIKLDFSDYYFIEKIKSIVRKFFVIDLIVRHNLSSFEENKAKVLVRFVYYCEGARNYCENYLDYFFLLIICFIRCLKFTIRYNDTSFISIFFKNFLFKNKLRTNKSSQDQ